MLELPMDSTIYELKIDQNANLIALTDKIYTWDSNYKGGDIEISNNDTSVSKKENEDFQTVLGVIPLCSGKHYWEIIVFLFMRQDRLMLSKSQMML